MNTDNQNANKSLKDDLLEFLANRQEHGGSCFMQDPEWQALTDEHNKLMEIIKEKVSVEIFMQLGDAEARLSALEINYSYQAGLRDGLVIKDIISSGATIV